MHYLLGIDGGGTGCRAVVCGSSGKHLGRGKAGPANILTDLEAARGHIVEACEAALAEAGIPADCLPEADAFLGLAGADLPACAREIKQKLPFKNCLVETDAVTSLEGAVGSGDGAVAIVGTGSAFISRTGGEIKSLGGWGSIISDLGGGARLGRDLLQEALLAHDKIRPGSELTRRVLSHFQNDPSGMAEYAHKALPGDFATFAPWIFDHARQRDFAAQNILRQAVRAIEESLDAILIGENQQFCMLGGLGPLYAELLREDLRGRIHSPRGDSLSGAAALAFRHFSAEEKA